MPEPARIPVGGKFVLDDGTVPSWFQGEIAASREALIRAGEYRDLGPIRVGLADDGTVMRIDGGDRVPLTLVRPVPGQEFYYRVWVRGDRMERVDASFLATDDVTEIDLPTALRSEIPAEEVPEWLAVVDGVMAHAQSAIQAAGIATGAASTATTACDDAEGHAQAASESAAAAQTTADGLYLTVEYDPDIGFIYTQGAPYA